MTNEEIMAYQAGRKAFFETGVGRALHKFTQAAASMWREDQNDSISVARLRKLDAAYKAAEQDLIDEIKELQEAAR